MPISPYAQLLVSRNGGTPSTGGIIAASTDVVQLVSASTSQLFTLWEIYAYPSGWATPAGWSKDANSGIILSTALSPPTFIPSVWGKYLLRLTVENGLSNGAADRTRVDTSTAIKVASPNGLHDLTSQEQSQFGADWTADHQANLRAIDALILGGGALNIIPTISQSSSFSVSKTVQSYDVDCTADVTATLPSSAFSNGQTHDFTISSGSKGLTVQSALVDIVSPIIEQGLVSLFTFRGIGASVKFRRNTTLNLWLPK